MVDRGRIDQRAEKLADLLPADPPAMERQVGRFLENTRCSVRRDR
jgi:hypothetical protein